MRLLRAALTVSALTCLLATPAGAAPRCKLLVDPVGDTGVQDEHVDGYGADVDIVSADIATSRTHLTAVVRVRSMTSTDPVAAQQGRQYQFFFSVGGERHYSLTGRPGRGPGDLHHFRSGWTNPEEERPAFLESNPGTRIADATVKVVGREVRITVPLAVFRLHRDGIKRGTRLYDFAAVTTRSVGDYPGSPVPSRIDLPAPIGYAEPWVHPGNAWDVANGTKRAVYHVGEPSCMRPG